MKNNIYAALKKDLAGYLALLIIVLIIIFGRLLTFFIFLIFLYLFSDVFIKVIHNRFPFLSKKLLFYIFYLLLITLFLFISFKVIPIFITDLSKYSQIVEKQASNLVKNISERYGLEFDFTSIRDTVFSQGTMALKQFFILFKGISNGFIYFIFALVVNFLLFFEKDLIRSTLTSRPGSLMTYLYYFIRKRAAMFYVYFKMVMGGQVIISLINTFFTLVIIIVLGLPNKISLVSLVFLFGLLPIIGNVISNTILSVTALIFKGIIACIICLVFLISIHKLEYFLNSKIIGSIVKLPMFLMLLSLLLFEAMLGIWGLIIAIPVVLFLKQELECLSLPETL